MSRMWECNDGSTDVTGRGSQGKVPCANNGGVFDGDTPYPNDRIPGCTEPSALNYLATANVDDGSCNMTTPHTKPSDDVVTIIEGSPSTAGFGDNKMLIYLVGAGVLLWYLNKEGYLKKLIK